MVTSAAIFSSNWVALGRALVATLLAAAACLPAACGDGDPRERVALEVIVQWQEHPDSVADMGYRVYVNGRWAERAGNCAHIPVGVRVTINQIEATRPGAPSDCDAAVWFNSGPFPVADPLTVRMLNQDRLIGSATFTGMFWGARARLVSPSVANVTPGEQVVVSFPQSKDPLTETTGRWYGLDDTTTGQLPYTLSRAQVSDGMTISTRVPDVEWLRGRTVLTFDWPVLEYLRGEPCVGFSSCDMWPRSSLGPISLDVLSP